MLTSWKESISQLVLDALKFGENSQELSNITNILNFEKIFNSISKPRDIQNGDVASNIVFFVSKKTKSNPTIVGKMINEKINRFICEAKTTYDNCVIIEKVEFAPPGFINFWISPKTKFEVISKIIFEEEFGIIKLNNEQKIILEFVSANPTGPLHVGHARQAALGDAIAKILKASGASVCKEFYYNDAGNQIENLMLSVKARLEKISPSDPNFPKDGYKGDYIIEICKQFDDENANSLPKGELTEKIKNFSVDYLRREQNNDLTALGVNFDSFKLESSFYLNGEIEKIVETIKNNDKTYEKDSALWFKSSFYGDDKDRVMRKADGNYTYFVPDIAYHLDKWKRGFKRAINIQGLDHHGTLKRVAAGLQALNEGIEKDFPKTILHKMVKVVKDGEEVKVSKRSGTFITLRDLICWAGNIKNNEEFIDLVNNEKESHKLSKGRDVVRYFLTSKKAETEFTFDVNIAQKQNDENPVFYIQYAYARAVSLINQSGLSSEELIKYFNTLSKVNLVKISELLDSTKESILCMRLAEFPRVFETAVTELAPHVITFYVKDLASDFHSYYNDTKINVEDETQKRVRLLLVLATSMILQKSLSLLGISSPPKM